MIEIKEFIEFAVDPALIAAFIFIAAHLRTRTLPSDEPKSSSPEFAWAIAIGIGYYISVTVLLDHGLVKIPLNAAEWLRPTLIAATFLPLLVQSRSLWLKAPLHLVLGAATFAALLQPMIKNYSWPANQSAVWIASLTAGWLVTWFCVRSGRSGSNVPVRPLILILVLIATSMLMALSGSLLYFKIGVGATAVTVAAAVVALCYGDSGKLEPALTPILLMVASLLLLGTQYAEVQPTHAILVAAAVLSAGEGGLIGRLAATRPWLASLLRLVWTVGFLAWPMAQAALTFIEQANNPNPYASNPYG